ncbi:GntR family transcriptional regulator [Streptosporangium roseum]|uniref:GntR family transcriptional regulator n=1 Tax=Streptosporangium roseum TaxID=2001 RepID=UPI0004CCEF90|nr:GntR family transcriptional regulator [Streptosporangium roseum]
MTSDLPSGGPADPLAPYLQVADALRSRIRHGDLAPGDKLPSQRDLAEHYTVARATVQAALRVLRAEELIVSRAGSGNYIAAPPHPSRPGSSAPKIRVHRYEHILAIKWPEFEQWLMVWPREYAQPGQAAATTEWRPLLFGEADFDDRHEWIDPAAEHWADVTPWTAQVRRQLAAAAANVNGILDQLDEHPWRR